MKKLLPLIIIGVALLLAVALIKPNPQKIWNSSRPRQAPISIPQTVQDKQTFAEYASHMQISNYDGTAAHKAIFQQAIPVENLPELYLLNFKYEGTDDLLFIPVRRRSPNGDIVSAGDIQFEEAHKKLSNQMFNYTATNMFTQTTYSKVDKLGNVQSPVCTIQRYMWNYQGYFEEALGSVFPATNETCTPPYHRVFTSIRQVTQQDVVDFFADHGRFFEKDALYGLVPFKDYPYFAMFASPGGPSGSEYNFFFVDKGELKQANLSFGTAATVGVWANFGYSKKGDFFYEATGMPSSYSEEKGTPCSLTTYVWDDTNKVFNEEGRVNFSSFKDDFCSDKFEEYGVTKETVATY